MCIFRDTIWNFNSYTSTWESQLYVIDAIPWMNEFPKSLRSDLFEDIHFSHTSPGSVSKTISQGIFPKNKNIYFRSNKSVKVYLHANSNTSEDVIHFHRSIYQSGYASAVSSCFTFQTTSKVPVGITYQVLGALILSR